MPSLFSPSGLLTPGITMKHAILLAFGLMMANGAWAASTTGTIQVRLTIMAQCHIDGQSTTATTPGIDCGSQAASQPKVTQDDFYQDIKTHRKARLVTVEW